MEFAVAVLALSKQEEKVSMSHPLVVNKHRGKRFDVYVGRPSKWGNPFLLGQDGDRETVIRKYRGWLTTRPELMRALPELKGKVLGCYCAPLPCHADVLAEMANGCAVGNMSLFAEGE